MEDYLREEKADTRVNNPHMEQLMKDQKERDRNKKLLRINPTTTILVPPEKNNVEYAVKYLQRIEKRNGSD